MKIISKYKDYYDYLQGVYGVDNRLILDRRNSKRPTYYSNGIMIFTIGNINVDVLCINNKFYCGEADMISLGGEKLENKDSPELISYKVNYPDYFNRIRNINISVTPWGRKRSSDKFDEYAIYLNEFVGMDKTALPYPRLEQYGIQKVLPPHEIWIELSNWLGQQLSKKEPTVPIGDDKTRIQSHGFDLKTSFRH